MDSSAVKTSILVRLSGRILFLNQLFSFLSGAVTDGDRSSTLRLLQDLSMQNPRTFTPERLELLVVSGRSQPTRRDFCSLPV